MTDTIDLTRTTPQTFSAAGIAAVTDSGLQTIVMPSAPGQIYYAVGVSGYATGGPAEIWLMQDGEPVGRFTKDTGSRSWAVPAAGSLWQGKRLQLRVQPLTSAPVTIANVRCTGFIRVE